MYFFILFIIYHLYLSIFMAFYMLFLHIFLLIFYLVVLDGNHKNHRARCVSSYQTASNDDNDMCCKETPLQGSYFCLKHNLLTQNVVNSFNQVSPYEDSKPIHKEVDSSLDPHLLIFLHDIIKILKTGIFQGFDQCIVLRKVLILSIGLGLEHFA